LCIYNIFSILNRCVFYNVIAEKMPKWITKKQVVYLHQLVDVDERVHGLALVRCWCVPLALAPRRCEVHLTGGYARAQHEHGQQQQGAHGGDGSRRDGVWQGMTIIICSDRRAICKRSCRYCVRQWTKVFDAKDYWRIRSRCSVFSASLDDSVQYYMITIL